MSHLRASAALVAVLCGAASWLYGGATWAAEEAASKEAASKEAASKPEPGKATAGAQAGDAQKAAPGAGQGDEPIDLSNPDAAPAEPDPVQDVASYPERRCGFTLGVMPLALMGASTGYPNDALRIGRDEFLTDTGFVGGGAGLGWIGIAVADWLVFGVGGNYGRMFSGEYDVSLAGGAFHIDLFPLFGEGGVWEELGVSLEAGLSFTTTKVIETEQTVIDGGTSSRVGLGLFYEGIRAWKLSMGPYVGVDTTFSQSAVVPAAAIGWRTVLYGGPAEVEPETAEPETTAPETTAPEAAGSEETAAR